MRLQMKVFLFCFVSFRKAREGLSGWTISDNHLSSFKKFVASWINDCLRTKKFARNTTRKYGPLRQWKGNWITVVQWCRWSSKKPFNMFYSIFLLCAILLHDIEQCFRTFGYFIDFFMSFFFANSPHTPISSTIFIKSIKGKNSSIDKSSSYLSREEDEWIKHMCLCVCLEPISHSPNRFLLLLNVNKIYTEEYIWGKW